jgi:hypothetical protein
MGWASYAENMNDIRCDLEHFAGCSSKSAELDPVAVRAVLDAAERALRQLDEAREITADPYLDLAVEIVRLRAQAAECEKQRQVDKELINRLARDVVARGRDTAYWRDAYLELSHRIGKARRGRHSRLSL